MKKFSEFYFEKFNENVPNTVSDAEKDDYFQEKNKFRGSKSRVEGGHPEVTLQMDKTNGSLHIWMGKQNIDLKNGKFVATTLKKRMMRPDAEKESDVVVRDPKKRTFTLYYRNSSCRFKINLVFFTKIKKKFWSINQNFFY